MNATELKAAFSCLSKIMTENKDYLTKLDQQNGDGDLGISMANGFYAVNEYLASADESDLGVLLMRSSSVFNDKAPSSLGTVLSFGLMSMARSLKGKADASLIDIAEAMKSAVGFIMEKAGSKPGEKTVLDSLCPGVDKLVEMSGVDSKTAFKAAADISKEGAESTRQMRAVHGRAAYYGDKSIGVIDGGAVVGSLIFEALYDFVSNKEACE